ncbi:hypothetical protein [Williamsia muralis]|uniref:Uncharacterized protein n=1 Tax=Williamsia marianensis TaxID=85044 RepID=A0ABU4F172_WILMA|nr:hypothetical protein [Williamsia muralis]MDV7136731.1 hypothetical protein [Williamsia muralis]
MTTSAQSFQALIQARADVAACHKALRRAKEHCVAKVADSLPSRIDANGEEFARSQPDTTIDLGVENVQLLRQGLAALAAKFSDDLRTTWAQLSWTYHKNEVVKSSLNDYFSGQRIDEICAVLASFGYEAGRLQTPAVTTDALFDAADPALSAAMESVSEAETALTEAEQVHKQECVKELWAGKPVTYSGRPRNGG